MLGQIFFSLQKFAQRHLGASAWSRLVAEAGIAPKMYLPMADYPDQEAIALVLAASRLANRPAPELLEAFGEAIVGDLVTLYRTLLRPEWKTLDLISNAEEVIHAAIRQRNPAASPPILQCLRFSETELQLVYTSERRLCPLARGIIKGVASHYKESVEVQEHSCMLQGDPFCTMHIVLTAAAPVVAADLGATTSHTPAPLTETPSNANAWGALSGVGLQSSGQVENAAMPSQVGQYRILQRLGAGGMGVVYMAEDPTLGRRVALKLMLPEVAAVAANRERFLREARAMAALTSDHIVTVYQVGQHGDRPFIAMPLLRGQTLEQRLAERGPPPHETVVRIGREIAMGLSAAHDQGIVHRDIKPSNIWVEEPHDRVKILDFGMARALVDAPHVTQAGTVVGTPHYMSPEQAAGEVLDGRTDLFSLGVILYRMLSGQLPFRGTSTIAVLRAVAVDSPRPLVEVVPDISSELSELVMLLLAKTAAERPASARAVAEELAKLAARAERLPSV